MKNIYEVIEQKETALAQVQHEVEALHTAMDLLTEEGDADASTAPPTTTLRKPPETEKASERVSGVSKIRKMMFP